MIPRWITLIVLFGCASLCAQNINLYLTLLEKGQMQEVKDNLPELLDRYPNEAGIYFLQAMVNNNGELSLGQFQSLAKKFPNSEFASKSDMKVGEYLFARGLYTQASIQFKRTIFKYAEGDHHQRAMDLMVNSYFATGQEDSVIVALKIFKQLYPSLNYDQYGIEGLDKKNRDVRLIRLDSDATTSKIKSRKARRSLVIPKHIPKPWVIQVGAFGKYENANRLKKQLQGHGYATEVHTFNSNGKRLHAVRIVRFETKEAGDKIGKRLKKKFGLDFRVLNNPE